MTWEIVAGLIALVGFGLSVMTPIVKLNTSITKLNCSIDSLNKNMARNEERITSHGRQIDDHEHRITVLESAERRAEAQAFCEIGKEHKYDISV